MAYSSINNYEKSIINFKTSIEIYKEQLGNDDISVGNRLNNLAEAYRNSRQFKEALELFEEALRIKRLKFKSDNERSIANTLANIG